MKTLVLIILTILSGCHAPIYVVARPVLLDVKPGQEVVVSYAWASYALYNHSEASDRIPPTIDWREGKELDCGNGRGFESAGEYPGNRVCLRGGYAKIMHLAIVARSSLDMRLTDTSLLHELCHAFFLDNDHAVCNDDEPPIAPVRESLKAMGY